MSAIPLKRTLAERIETSVKGHKQKSPRYDSVENAASHTRALQSRSSPSFGKPRLAKTVNEPFIVGYPTWIARQRQLL
jgi:hypothetical protein